MKTKFLLIVGLTLCAATASFAQSSDEQQACQDDAFNICGAFIPDRDRVFNCMVQNKDQLSARCRAVMAPFLPQAAPPPIAAKTKPKVQGKPKTTSKGPINLNPK